MVGDRWIIQKMVLYIGDPNVLIDNCDCFSCCKTFRNNDSHYPIREIIAVLYPAVSVISHSTLIEELSLSNRPWKICQLMVKALRVLQLPIVCIACLHH